MTEDIKRLMVLFDGLPRAYGTYRVTGVDRGKQTGVAVTVMGAVTEELWEGHLAGRQGIGIIPIRDDSTCCFGAIDVDQYSGIDYKKIITSLRKRNYPLVPCTSKSGGLHLYLFSSKSVDAATMRTHLSTMAASLGFGESEVFPKQDKILVERGDLGSWINMPYFEAGKTSRTALGDKGERLSLSKFLDLAERLRVDATKFKVPGASGGDFVDGPPCLQYLVEKNEVGEGMRNVTMFNVAVYLKRALIVNWEAKLMEINDKLRPPLAKTELSTICKSVKRREYFYACSKPPLSSFCDRGSCRGRKYGVGTEGDFPLLTGLTKYNTVPPLWFVDVEGGGRVELTTEDLQNQIRFQRHCMEGLNKMPPVIKPEQWRTLVQSLMEKMVTIEVPEDASAIGQFWGHLENFCTARAQARTKEEILIGKPWLSEGRHYFRISDFTDYLERRKFREFKVNKVTQIIKSRGGEHHFLRLHAKGINVWSVREFERKDDSSLPTIETEKSPI